MAAINQYAKYKQLKSNTFRSIPLLLNNTKNLWKNRKANIVSKSHLFEKLNIF